MRAWVETKRAGYNEIAGSHTSPAYFGFVSVVVVLVDLVLPVLLESPPQPRAETVIKPHRTNSASSRFTAEPSFQEISKQTSRK
jgi:hypothetical protein